MLILLIEILGGLIIDTFAELRQESKERENDMNNVCFICGLESKDLDRLGNM